MEGGRCYRAETSMPFAGADGVSRVVVGHIYDLQARSGGLVTRIEIGRSLVAAK